MEEIWKTISYSNKYQISTLGRLRTNFDKYKHIFTNEYKIIDGTINKDGYNFVILRDKKINLIKSIGIHRLVMETFAPLKNMKLLQVNHKNWNRADNRLENLEWVTAKENVAKRKPKEQHYNSNIVYDEYGNRFNSYIEASKKYKIAPNTIKNDIKYKRKNKTKTDRPRFYTEKEYIGG